MLSDDDKFVVGAMLTRYQRLWLSNDADKKLRDEADARVKANQDQFKKLHAAFSIFGFETNVTGGFKLVKEALGEEAFNEAIHIAESTPGTEKLRYESPKTLLLESPPTPETVREFVLDRLKVAGDKGCKAIDMRKYIEAERSTALHDKTVGMTLYRLSRAGLARRAGRTWFFVPQEAETKNPGAETPGLIILPPEKETADAE